MKRFLLFMLISILSICFICCGDSVESSSKNESESEIQSIESVESFEESHLESESQIESQSQSEGQSESTSEEESESEENTSESTSEEESESEESISEENVYYTVTFDSNGGSEIDNISVKGGDKISKPQDPQKSSRTEDYEFVCWLYNGEEWNFETDVVTQDITLVAEWEVVATYPPAVLPED